MKIYGHPMSTCTQKALVVCAEKGHDVEVVVIDLMKGEHKQPAFLEKQPFGVVPVLEDDGFVLYESRAIMRYLDQKLPGASLTPSDLKERAQMEQWISVEQSYFSPAALKIMFQRLFAPMRGAQPDEAIVEQGRQEVTRVLDVAGKTLAKQEYFAGSAFTLADITWMPYVQYLFAAGCGDLVTSNPHVSAWWKRVSERPSWLKVAAQAAPKKG